MCGGPNSMFDTWAGNQFFNIGKFVVAATNSLWYLVVYGDEDGPLFSRIDDGLSTGAKSIYDNAFTPLLSLVLILAVIWMLFRTLKGALAHTATKLLWVFCALWVAASSYLMPTAFTSFLDSVLTDGVREIQGAVLRANGYDELHGMPELLYDHTIRNTWLEGEFGSADSTIAKQQGPRLIDAQAWTKFDTTETVTQADLDRKKATFVDVANKVKGTEAEGHFTGAQGSRLGTGFVGAVRGICFAYLPLVTLLGQLLGMLILRLVILAGPVLGLAMIVYNRAGPGVARGLGKCLSSCILLAVGSTVYLWLLSTVLPNIQSAFLQLIVMGAITAITLILFRPIRQITGMISGIVQAAGLHSAGAGTMTGRAARGWRKYRRWKKREKRILQAVGRGSQAKRKRRPETAPAQKRPVSRPTGPVSRQHSGPNPITGAPQRATSVRLSMHGARQHGPAHRAGTIGPRIFFQGPRVFHQGPASPPAPPTSTTPPALPVSPSAASAPSSGTPVGDEEPLDQLVIPTEHERAESQEPEPSAATPQLDDHGRPVVEIYHPSQNQIVQQPIEPDRTAAPVRPEADDRGEPDANPI
jgi:hypothetical protein